jgi:hypothetical protein
MRKLLPEPFVVYRAPSVKETVNPMIVSSLSTRVGRDVVSSDQFRPETAEGRPRVVGLRPSVNEPIRLERR